MKTELVLALSIAAVWAALAAVYALSPDLGMPGYVRVWGAGALLFLALAAILIRAWRSG
jgi:multisubunit Na+/H+ antiporter MnhB subunit